MIRRILLALACFAVAATVRAGVIQFAQSNFTFQEGSGTGMVTLLRTGATGSSLAFNYMWSYAGGVLNSGSLSFAPGEASKAITIIIPNDNVYMAHPGWPGLYGTISAHDANGGDASATLTIMDDEPVPVVTGPPEVSVTEGNSGTKLLLLHFTLSAPFGGNYAPTTVTFGGTIDANDIVEPLYNSGPDVNGRTAFDIRVTIKGDSAPEPDETIIAGVDIGYPNIVAHGEARVVILNDEFSLTPPGQRIELGKSGSITLITGGGPLATERFALSSSDPAIASVPPFIDVLPGQAQVAIPVTTHAIGLITISIGMPVSRGGATLTSDVTVFQQSGLGLDRAALTLTLGAQATVKATLDPPPLVPLTLLINNNRPSVAETPFSFVLGTGGSGTFTVRGIAVGSATVIIPLTAEYGGGAANLAVEVTQPAGLAITSFSSKSGPTTGDQQVKLFGNNMKGRCTVTFGGVSALNTSVAAGGAVTAYTPPHAAGVVDVGIRCGTEEFTFANGYTYVAAAPRITRIAPATGTAEGGTIVTAAGENLPRGHCGLWFGNAPATTVLNLQSTEMTAVAPAHAPGVVAVTVRCGADASTLNDAFVYAGDEPAAQIAAVSPSSAAPGERVLIGGSRFRFSDAIAFGGAAAIDMTTAPAEHFVTVPELAAGSVAITLRDANGRVITAPPFTVKPPATPQITSARAKVTVGAELVVSGSGFRPSLPFLLGGVALRPVVLAPTFAVLRVPATTQPGATNLTLSDAGATVALRAMEVTSAGVAVESASPQCISTDGGALITIRGSGFEPGAVVTFGAADGTEVAVRDSHTITARAPASSGVSDATITVINPSLESGQLTAGFQYRWPDSACGPARHRPARH